MTDARSQPEEPIDVRLLAREGLPHEAFPGGRNEGLRVFFTPEVHAALWRHAALDTTVEICGVLVGSWHRDEAGPFVKVAESIRGEGAETRFAEVTFTHQTWAKINAEMDTKFTKLSIVGWYHTHPDFGIFLSDRDRFIHEHFFSGPGQIAHVIDPIRKIEGVFLWRNGKPDPCEHFWIGDRIMAQSPHGPEKLAETEPGLHSRSPRASGSPGTSRASDPAPDRALSFRDLFPHPGRLLAYAAVFFLGYLLANVVSAWEHQRFVESVLASNGLVAMLRLGLADELDGLQGDLAAMVRPIEALRSKPDKPEEPLAEIRTQLISAARRTVAIKAQYGNTPAEDNLLRRMLRDRLMKQSRSGSLEESTEPEPLPKVPAPVIAPSTTETPSPAQPSSTRPDESATDAAKNSATPKP
jgi:proteasome lid subunit RPN8/RPN11